MGENAVALLAEEMGEESYAGGTFVFRQGDPAARVHVLRTGTIELSREVKGRRVTLQVLRPGDVFGDVPVFLGDPEPFDARAFEDCTVLALDAAALFQLLQTRPLVARRWFVSLAERMAGLQNRLVDLLAGGIDRGEATASASSTSSGGCGPPAVQSCSRRAWASMAARRV